MTLFRRSFVCPYCFERSLLKDVQFRCSNDPRRCAPEPDKLLGDFQRSAPPMKNKVVRLPTPDWFTYLKQLLFMPREASCHHCGEKTNIRICPHCHSELPYTIGDYKDLIFAVIGGPDSGKSHYISVLIDKIKNEVGSDFECILHPINDETVTRYRDDFYTPLFRNHETLKKTLSASSNLNSKMPLIYTLAFREKIFFTKMTRAVVTLVFFDTAGEDLDATDTMRIENKYIYNSAGIILLYDPLQVPVVREQLPQSTLLPPAKIDAEDILVRVINLIKNAKQLKPIDTINIPIAIAFSKVDAIDPILDPSSVLKYNNKHYGYFDTNEFQNVHDEMQAHIKEWTGDSFVNLVNNSFKKVAFFGLTALGCAPDSQNKVSKLRPQRVEEPFLWLLWQHGLIRDQSLISQFLIRIKAFFNRRWVIISMIVILVLIYWSF